MLDVCLPNFGFTSATVFDQTTVPLARSRQSTRNWIGSDGADPMPHVESDITPPIMPLGRPPLGATAVVRKIRSPDTTGCDQPEPGTAVRQATFLSASQASGTFAWGAWLSAAPPRNCGQSSAIPVPPLSNTTTAVHAKFFITAPPCRLRQG